MLKVRVIPSLLVENGGLVKTVKFRPYKYVGDPINAIKIFNDKEVDELAVLDIQATRRGSIDYSLLARMNKEAFMPLSYGGGVRTVEEVKRILGAGYEKVIVDSHARGNPAFIGEAASYCGSQSVVVCIDVKRDIFGNDGVYDYLRSRVTRIDPVQWARTVEEGGAGEILLYDVDREGTMSGYDTRLIKRVSSAVSIPVVALGGASSIQDFAKAIAVGGASAVAAGSLFVFQGPHRAVLITYPDKKALAKELAQLPARRAQSSPRLQEETGRHDSC